MDTRQAEALPQRVARLERENRRWKALGIVALALLGVVGLLGATSPGSGTVADEIRARRFILVDDAGRDHAALGIEPGGAAGLAFAGPDGKLRALLGIEGDGSGFLGLADRSGTLRVMLGAMEGSAGLNLADRAGKDRAGLVIAPDGTGGLTLSDPSGRARAVLALEPGGLAALEILDPAGKPAFRAPR